MRISALAIHRPIFAMMVVAAMVVFGIISYSRIGVDLFPSVDFPIVTVRVVYEGADPQTIETDVTEPLEEAINTISGIKSLRSESSNGVSLLLIEFQLSRDIDVATQDVRDKVTSIRPDLPLRIEQPIVEKFDPDSAPIMSISLSGPSSIRELTRFADRVIKPQIEGENGVGSVSIIGGREREIRIWLRTDDLRSHDLTAEEVIASVEAGNTEYPGGRIETGNRELVVKTKGRLQSPADFQNIVIKYRGLVPIRLRDVATVEDGMEDFRTMSRLNGQRAVSLEVRRQSGENMLAVANAVKRRLERIGPQLPAGYEMTLTQDLSRFVVESVNETQTGLLLGGGLAVLVILAFLRSWRGALVAAITIPTTVITTYALMLMSGFTLNVMSLLALSISVGMVIDDSIVVLENAYRQMENGKNRLQAALDGIGEIGFAVIATSLAIVAVFVPVAFMDGLIGRFFVEFGLTVAFAVIVSTFIAIWLSPMLCSRILKVVPQHGWAYNLVENFFIGIETVYRTVLAQALRRRWTVVMLAVGFFVGSLLLLPWVGTEFTPEQDEAQFRVQIETPLGSSIERTSRILEELERRLWTLPYVESLYTTIGSGQQDRVNYGAILVQLPDKSQRSLSQHTLMAMTRELAADLTHSKISVEYIPRVSGGGFRAAPIQYNLRGDDVDQLEKIGLQFTDQLRQIPGIVDINLTYDSSKPEIAIIPDRERAADLGISIEDLGKAVLALVGGRQISTYEEDGKMYDVRIRLAQGDRDRTAALAALPVRTRFNELVDFRNVAVAEEITGPVQIDRENRRRQVTVMANLEKTKPLGSAINDILEIEQSLKLPANVSTAFSGAADLMEETFTSMIFALVLAIVLIYMVLASQFESLIHPITIMLSVPLSIGGAMGALALAGLTLNIFSMIGMVMLMGLVTKNAILLVDYTNLLRRGRGSEPGLDKTQALLIAGPVRLRPILMTTFSTIAGMLPIALGVGAGSESRQPMGACVIGGMLTSTLLTLVVIPVVYSLFDDLGNWLGRLLNWQDTSSFQTAKTASDTRLPVDGLTQVETALNKIEANHRTKESLPAIEEIGEIGEIEASKSPDN